MITGTCSRATIVSPSFSLTQLIPLLDAFLKSNDKTKETMDLFFFLANGPGWGETDRHCKQNNVAHVLRSELEVLNCLLTSGGPPESNHGSARLVFPAQT